MELTQDKAVGRTGDDQDEVVQPAETHMQVDDESERADHDQANTDTGSLAQQDQQMCTEEQPCDQLNEALQTTLVRDTEAAPSLAQRDGVEPISAAATNTNAFPRLNPPNLWHWRFNQVCQKHYPCCTICDKDATDEH